MNTLETTPAKSRSLPKLARITSRLSPGLVCCLVLLLMGANLFSVMRRKTITNDEIVHIPAGYQYLTAGNFRLNPEHPPLIKMWATLPLLVIKPEPSLISPGSDVES